MSDCCDVTAEDIQNPHQRRVLNPAMLFIESTAGRLVDSSALIARINTRSARRVLRRGRPRWRTGLAS